VRNLIVVLLLSLLVSASAAQQVPPADGPSAASAQSTTATGPVFRSRSESVLVPVVVLSKHNQHVSGVQKDAFELLEDGKEQTIASLEEVQPRNDAAEASKKKYEGYSNLRLDPAYQPQVTILVLDFFNANQFQRTDAKDLLLHFLSKDLQADGTFSLLCITSNGLVAHSSFTDREELLRTLRDLNTEGGFPQVHHNAIRWTLEQVRQIADAYAGVPGRKTMVWMSGVIPYPEIRDQPDGTPAQVLRMDFDETRKSLLSANVAVYPVGLSYPSVDASGRTVSNFSYYQSLRYFADATGGSVCIESNRLADCLNEAVDDSRSYYMLSYIVKPDDRRPGWRKLEVKLKEKQAEVRARSGFFYEDHSTPFVPAPNHADEIAALASPVSQSAVRMNVRVLDQFASSTPSSDKRTVAFLMIVPLTAINVDSSRSNSLDLNFGAIALDKKVKEAGEFLVPVKGNPSPDVLKRLATEGIRVREKLELLPGVYDMRFLVQDNSTGLIGTVVFPLEVK
jgi:VWFA-related protein